MFTPQRALITWPLLLLFSLISFIIVQLCLVPLLLCVLQISNSSPALPTVSDPWNGFLGNPTGFLLEGCSLGEPIFDKEGFYTPLSLIFPSQRLACMCVCAGTARTRISTRRMTGEKRAGFYSLTCSLSRALQPRRSQRWTGWRKPLFFVQKVRSWESRGHLNFNKSRLRRCLWTDATDNLQSESLMTLQEQWTDITASGDASYRNEHIRA